MFDLKLILLSLGLLFYLYLTPVSYNQNRVQVENVYYNVSEQDFFDFITEPAVFSKWFRWPTMVTHANDRPQGPGKRYFVKMFRSKVVFETSKVVKTKNEVRTELKADALFRPVFELRVHKIGSSKPSRLKLNLALGFRRESLLFRFTIGKFLCLMARKKMIEAVENLEMVMNHYNLVPVFYTL